MKLIKKNSISGVNASSWNTAYPAQNLLDGNPNKRWKASSANVNYAYLDLWVSGVTGALALIGVKAESVIVDVVDPTGIDWGNRVDWDRDTPLESDVIWGSSMPPIEFRYELSRGLDDYQNVWVSFDQFDTPVTIRIELRKSATNPDTLSAGVLQIGEPVEFPNVQKGLQEGLEDYSIMRQLKGGGIYYKKQDIARTFSGTMLVERKTYFQEFMRDVARIYGAAPLIFNLAPNVDDSSDFLVYGRLITTPTGSHSFPNHSYIQFQILEVV